MLDVNIGMAFRVAGKEVGHVSGVVPIPRVGEMVHYEGKLLGRVMSVEYHYRHIGEHVVLGVGVHLEQVG